MGSQKIKKPIIWISYAGKTLTQLNSLVDAFKDNWPDKVEIRIAPNYDSGERFADRIYDDISSSDAQILLLSPFFDKRKWCRMEVAWIKSLPAEQKRIFPFVVVNYEAEQITKGLSEILETTQVGRVSGVTCLKYGNSREYSYKDFAKLVLEKLGIELEDQETPKDNHSIKSFLRNIINGEFTPFIGPDCYGLQEEWRPEIPTLQTRLKQLEDGLDETERNFAKAVVASRVPCFGAQQDQQNTRTSRPPDLPSLIELLIAITKAGAAASRLIGRSLSKGEALIDSRYFSISFKAEEEKALKEESSPRKDIRILRESLATAELKASEIINESYCLAKQPIQMCLGSTGIARKIGLLRNFIFGTDTTEANSYPAETNLTLSQLDWLGDLLWHTMRYDIPVLLRTDELAFQISVCKSSECPTRVPLGTAAVISDNGQVQCTGFIHTHLSSSVGEVVGRRKASSFYHAIAKILWQHCDEIEIERTASTDKGNGSAELAFKHITEVGCYPMAVSVNIDSELESCLETVPYSVIYPVKSSGGIDAWMLRIHEPNKKETRWLLKPDVSFEKIVRKTLRGPLILKLRGSPLEKDHSSIAWLGINYDDPKQVNSAPFDRTETVSPRLILSSLDYFRGLSAPDMGAPACLKEQLGLPSRVKCFFGYPLDDPDCLLGIQRGVWVAEHTDEKDDDSKKSLSVGCKRNDGLGNALLSGLRVEPLHIELENVADEISRMKELKDLPVWRREND